MRHTKAQLEDPEVVADFLRQGYRNGARKCRSVPVIHAALRLLEDARDPVVLFLRATVEGPNADVQWVESLDALRAFGTSYPWSSKQRRAKLQKVANDPRLLAGVQAVAATCEAVTLDWLAVLAIDGSDASVDALLPHVHRATSHPDERLELGLEALAELKVHAASNPSMTAFFALVDRAQNERSRGSAAMRIASKLGLSLDTFWFTTDLHTVGPRLLGPNSAWARVSIDSRRPDALRAMISHHDPDDRYSQLDLNDCEPEALPAALAKAAKRFRLEWNFDQARIKTHLRGKDRDLVVDWLRSGGASRSSPSAARAPAPPRARSRSR